VFVKTILERRCRIRDVSLCQLVQSLGVVVFQALDYGLSDTEEQKLSPALEQLIEQMTGSDSDDDTIDTKIDKHGDDADDEGIEHDAEDGDVDNDDVGQPRGLSLAGVIEVCHSKYRSLFIAHF